MKDPSIEELKIKIFADVADLDAIVELASNPLIAGYTTNPTLMRKAGVTDYVRFARAVLEQVPDRPISFEVCTDDFDEMEAQALTMHSWGEHVYVKIPITNTAGESSSPLLRRLSTAGVKVNVTALATVDQVRAASKALAESPGAIVSVFAGRIADTGRDPVPLMAEATLALQPWPTLQLLWASPRELLNVFQADAIGCDIVTATPDILAKLTLVGRDLCEYSLETVKMFFHDAQAAALSPHAARIQ